MGHKESSVGKNVFLDKNILPLTEDSLCFTDFLGTALPMAQTDLELKAPLVSRRRQDSRLI